MKKDFLYQLLPIIYRERDYVRGEPLRVLMETLQEPLSAIEDDIGALYDNWFIETCDAWLIPYIADLIGVRGLATMHTVPFGERSHVANTIAYRRRKGTAATLNHVIEDVTAWGARVVEFSALTAATQSLKHVRAAIRRTVDLRTPQKAGGIDGPFTAIAHSADLCGIARSAERHAPIAELKRGKYQTANVGIYLWRLASYPVIDATARQVAPGRYTFHPFGIDVPLLNNPRASIDFDRVAAETNLPVTLTRAALAAEIRARRQNRPSPTGYFESPPAFEIAIASDQGSLAPVSPEQIAIADLSEWNFSRGGDQADALVAVDPELGRLLSLDGVSPSEVRVSYSYGFSSDLGGGPYWRHSAASPSARRIRVHRDATPGEGFQTLDDALAAWSADREDYQSDAVIQIGDSSTYTLSAASNAPIDLDRYRLVIEALPGCVPCIIGDLAVTGVEREAELVLSGLWINGSIALRGGAGLTIEHCTIWPPDPEQPAAIVSDEHMAQVRVSIFRSITGPVHLSEECFQLEIRDSIVDGRGAAAIAGVGGTDAQPASGPPLALESVTIFGEVYAGAIQSASHVIFTRPATIKRCASGYLRMCYVPAGSKTPRRYLCVGELGQGQASPRVAPANKPRFTSLQFGDPAYAQLSSQSPRELLTLSQDGSEIGAFHDLHQVEREQRLRAILNEYLPYGLNAGIFYVT